MRAYYVLAAKAATDITGTILIPGLLALWLRSVYHNLAYEQLLFFISLTVVFGLSMWVVVKKIERYGREYKQLTDKK